MSMCDLPSVQAPKTALHFGYIYLAVSQWMIGKLQGGYECGVHLLSGLVAEFFCMV